MLSDVKTAFTCTPALTILVRLWVITISLVFFYPTKLLFSGFLQSKDYSVNGWNTVIEILQHKILATYQHLVFSITALA